jgi:hypothetical protein
MKFSNINYIRVTRSLSLERRTFCEKLGKREDKEKHVYVSKI